MRARPVVVGCLVGSLMSPLAAPAADVTLNAVQFPERRDVEITFARMAAAPRGRLTASVEFREGQGRIKISFSGMKPAVLFGGDVTSYVLWAVTREGRVDNLGELWVRGKSGSVEYSTGLKEFALMVTAEPYPLVDGPSSLLLFASQPADVPSARTTPFSFSGMGPPPRTERSGIADAVYDSDIPPDLVQAQTAFKLAQREGAESYAPEIMHEATITLAQATNLASASGHTKEMLDYARRTVSLASEALRTTTRAREAERLARLIGERRAEMQALQERAAQAESGARRVEKEKQELEAAVEKTRNEMTSLQSDRASLQGELAQMTAARAELVQSMAQLRAEKERLSARLEGALSQVAATRSTARGLIVDLPDILFDVDEATLKGDARITLAKLAGILLLMPELNLRIEGHTDSTGSPAHNLRLSERRADSVFDFLVDQGIASTRMKSAGYGQDRPIADNSTQEGRAKNRRVELVIAEGVVQESTQPQ